MAYSKPIPIPSEESKPFWEATKRGELLLQHWCDMPVEVVFEEITSDISLPRFRQAAVKS